MEQNYGNASNLLLLQMEKSPKRGLFFRIFWLRSLQCRLVFRVLLKKGRNTTRSWLNANNDDDISSDRILIYALIELDFDKKRSQWFFFFFIFIRVILSIGIGVSKGAGKWGSSPEKLWTT